MARNGGNMKKTILLVSLLLPVGAYAASEIEEAKRSVEALIAPILEKTGTKKVKSHSQFTVENCEKHKIDWMGVILMRKSAALTYTFKTGCDIEGVIQPTVIKPFETNLKLKNLNHFNHLKAENKITASLEAKPIMNLAIRGATLTGAKGSVLFEADYAVRIDPLKKKNPMEENLGGEIRVTEIYGKKVSIKEKIIVD
jgi:hypothetical protein